MSKRVTPEEIITFHKLYAKYHTYAEVARQTGRSAGTVAKYINLKNNTAVLNYTMHQVFTDY